MISGHLVEEGTLAIPTLRKIDRRPAENWTIRQVRAEAVADPAPFGLVAGRSFPSLSIIPVTGQGGTFSNSGYMMTVN